MEINRQRLYVALKAISRAENFLLKKGYFIDDVVQLSLEKMKEILLNQNIHICEYHFDAMLEEMDLLAIDFEDADDKEVIFNHFIFALSNLIYYFVAEMANSLDAACEDTIELYRYIVQNDYFKVHEINSAIIFTADQTNEIESNFLILNEKNAQEKDLEYAKTVIDWSLITI